MQDLNNAKTALKFATFYLANAKKFFFLAMRERTTEEFSAHNRLCLKHLLAIQAAIECLNPDAERLRKQGPKPLPETPNDHAG